MRYPWLLTLLCVGLALAAPNALATPPSEKGAYVTVNIGIELHALEKAANEIAQAVRLLASSAGTLATSPSLSPEQKAELFAVIGQVDALSGRVVQAVDRLPAAITETREPLTAIADELAYDVRLSVFFTLGLALLVVVVVLVGVYYWVLRPSRALVVDTVKGIASVVRSVENTAKMISRTTEQQTHLLTELQRAGLAGGEAPAASDAEEPGGP